MKITLWTKIAVVLLLQFLVVFRVSSYTLCVFRSQQSQMAAPMGQDTINFNSNNCNNLRLLFRTGSVPCDHKEALLSLATSEGSSQRVVVSSEQDLVTVNYSDLVTSL